MMSSWPPSQWGSGPLMAAPTATMSSPNNRHTTMDCRKTCRACSFFLAPSRCATCTVNPVVTALQMPPKSHNVVETSPIDAESSAPRLPTMEASMYCMMMLESCAMMAGTLSEAVSSSCCRSVMGLPSRMRASRPSLLVCAIGWFFSLQSY